MSPRSESSHIVKIRSDSCTWTAAREAVSSGGSAAGEDGSAFSVAGVESQHPHPVTRSLSQKKSVTFMVPDILFSEEDYAAAIALQEANEESADDDGDDAHPLAGMSSPSCLCLAECCFRSTLHLL